MFKRHSGRGRGDSQLRDSSAMSFILLRRFPSTPARPRPAAEPTKMLALHLLGSLQMLMAPIRGTQNKSYEVERITKLFEILSARSDIDHPVMRRMCRTPG